MPKPRALPARREALDAAGKYGAQLAQVVQSWVPPRRGSAELLRAYADLPWLHAVVRRRAEALAQVEWLLWRAKTLKGRAALKRLVRAKLGRSPNQTHEAFTAKTRALESLKKSGDIEPVYSDPLLDLLDRPWPSGGSEVALWELASKHQDLLGETFFTLERPRPGRPPTEILPVPPTWVRAIPKLGERDTFEVLLPWKGPVPVQQIDAIWIRQHDPADPFGARGVGTAMALADELETDEYMAATAKARFYNRAIPEVVLALLGSPTAGVPPPSAAEIGPIAEAIEQKHRGSERAGQFHLVAGDVDVHQIGDSFQASQYVQGREFLRNTCMQIFGTPPEVLGVLDNANRSTIDAASAHFATYSTLPQLERFRGALQLQLVPEFGTDLVLDYVSPVPTDKEFVKAMMVGLSRAFKKNEMRELAGYGPLPGDEGEALYEGPGAVPTPGEKPPVNDKAKPKTEESEDDDADDA